jgi:glycosyltransferase involved in cell wall biosynthesis
MDPLVTRLFARFADRISNKTLNSLYRLIDLYLCLLWLAVKIRWDARTRRVYVVVSLFQAFNAYEAFFRLIRSRCHLSVIVHDAVELKHSYPSFIMSDRDRMLGCAHRLLVHNKYSVEVMQRLGKPIDMFPFPPMRPVVPGMPTGARTERRHFVFVGHLRPEKGVGTLVDCWRRLPNDVRCKGWLTIAGSPAGDTGLDFSELPDSTVLLGFVEEPAFVKLILEADYMVFPYRGGTNSGVYSVASSLGRPSITSRIPVFVQSEFYDESLSFESEPGLTRLIGALIEDDNALKVHQDRVQSIVGHANENFERFFTERSQFFTPATDR